MHIIFGGNASPATYRPNDTVCPKISLKIIEKGIAAPELENMHAKIDLRDERA